jgi:hypothetical protein
VRESWTITPIIPSSGSPALHFTKSPTFTYNLQCGCLFPLDTTILSLPFIKPPDFSLFASGRDFQYYAMPKPVVIVMPNPYQIAHFHQIVPFGKL